MKKSQKNNILGNLLFGLFALSIAMVATVIVATGGVISASAEEAQPLVDLNAIADKAKTGWEELKEDLKDKVDGVIDVVNGIPAAGDLIQGDKNFSFSLIDGLVTDIELKIGDDISELEAEVERLEQTIDNQRKEIESHANEIARLNAEVTTLKSIMTFAGLLALGLIIYLVAILAGALAKIEKLQAKINQQDQPTPDKESPVNLKKDLRPRDGDEQ